MAKKDSKNKVLTKKYAMTMVILLFMAIGITFLSMLIGARNVNFMTEYYLQFLVATCFIFVLFVSVCFSVNSETHDKSVVFKNISIVVSSITIGLLVSVAFKEFIDEMALVLIFPALIVSVLLGRKVAMYTNVMTSIAYVVLILLEAIVSQSSISACSLIAALLSLLSGIFMISLVKKNYTRYKMIVGSICYAALVAVSAMPASLLYTFNYRLIMNNALWLFVGQAIAIALYSVLLPLYERAFEVYTDFTLAELASFSHPLLVRLREEAPGTFNHSLVVGNLAESCAIAVGEDPYLARVCAYYHDVGKLKNPYMFIENQDGSYNPHDELIPEISAKMITRHASAGYEILREYHMPEGIAKIAKEHHGTSPVMFFYMKAQKITEGKLSMTNYTYDGPKPSTKISAIIMICDTVEAAVRARQPKTEEELREFVKKMIKDKMDLQQFDDCGITFNDLKIIEDEIVKTIPSIFHHIIDYNKEKK